MYGMKTTIQEAKLTVRVPRDLLENIKNYAAENDTSLTNLIKAYLRRIPPSKPSDHAPIVRRLTGMMSQDVTLQDYRKHLEKKYGK